MRHPVLAVLALAAFLPATPLWAEAATPPAPETAAPTAPAITVTVAEPRLMRDRVLATGLIGAVEQVLVAPLVEGQQIEALLADVGDRVSEGKVLARLSKSSLELQRSQLAASLAAANSAIAQAEAQEIEARASADEANRAAERALKLKDQGSASQVALDRANAAAISGNARASMATQALESARANLAAVTAQLANVDLMLARTEVKAPVAGEITARNAQVGAIASAAGQPMFTLIRDGALEMRAEVADSDLLRLAPGQTATLRLTSEGSSLTGTIRLVEPAIDAATRMGRVRISLDPAAILRQGLFAEAEILVAERQTLAVPVSAIGTDHGQASVMLVQGDIVRRQPVTTGIRDSGWVEITQGLAPGDRIVAKAGAFVRDGDRITPVLAE